MNAIEAAQKLGVSFRRCNADEARQLSRTVEIIYKYSYGDIISSGNPFDSVEGFMARFDSYTSSPEFALVIAFHGDDPIGQSWGWPLRENSRWWNGLRSDRDADFTREDGRRTFALSEIMVVQNWTGKGVAHALHDALLAGRREQRATLLVEPDNLVARRAYEHWGWAKVGQLKPDWEGAPVFDAMTLDLATLRDRY
jgi:GNAT superfamily N-acetyltransferase